MDIGDAKEVHNVIGAVWDVYEWREQYDRMNHDFGTRISRNRLESSTSSMFMSTLN